MSTQVLAPMPGTIVRILVSVGEKVKEDQDVAILEAMKMENPIAASTGGTVKEIKVEPGVKVDTNQVLIVLE